MNSSASKKLLTSSIDVDPIETDDWPRSLKSVAWRNNGLRVNNRRISSVSRVANGTARAGASSIGWGLNAEPLISDITRGSWHTRISRDMLPFDAGSSGFPRNAGEDR